MPNYSLVPESISRLADRVGGLSRDRLSHDVRLKELDLENARMGLSAQNLAGNREIQMAQMQRDQYLDEPVSLGEAIASSKFDDQTKKYLVGNMTPEMQSLPTTRRKAGETIWNVIKAKQDQAAAKAKSQSEIEQKGLDRKSREEVARLNRQARLDAAKIQATGKPEDQLKALRLEAWNSYLKGESTPEQQKLIGVDKDPNLGRAIELIKNDDTMFGQPTEVIAERAKAIAGQLGGSKQQPKELTRDIAIEYLRKANGDKEAAKKLASDDGYQF